MLLLAAYAACAPQVRRDSNHEPPDNDDSVDASVDAATADARACWGTETEACIALPVAPMFELSGTLDTTSDGRCEASIAAHCVIAAHELAIVASATLDVTGTRPLVLIGTETIAIRGTLDAASHAQPRKPGPGLGTGEPACAAFTAAPSTQGGGAGGSFAGQGGAGGANSGSATGGGAAPTLAMAFRPGCRGQDGGNADASTGVGGDGGGAVYLIAGSTIEIAGSVNASGAAGRGGRCNPCALDQPTAFGGGGGGSGGTIVLEAPAILNTGRVFADGAGGGEGASRSIAGNGGREPDGAIAAAGGANGPSHGGDGGSGSHAAVASGTVGAPGSSNNPGAGGGGGGGAGAIRIRGASSGTGMYSPAATAP